MHRIDFLVPLDSIEKHTEMVEVVALGLADLFGGVLVMTVAFDSEDDTVTGPDHVMFRVHLPERRWLLIVPDTAQMVKSLYGLNAIKVGIDGNIHEM